MTKKKQSISRVRRLINRSAQFARRRHYPDGIPHTISTRRIYIIPSRFGLVYALSVFVLLLGAMNYSNALAFFLTFLLAGAGFVAMHLTNSNLAGINTEPAIAEAVFAHEPAILKLRLYSGAKKLHPEIQVSNPAAQTSTTNSLVDQDGVQASLILPTHQRGYVELDHFSISTRFPLNLFYAWSVVFQPLRCLVYPTPSDSAPDVYGEHSQDDSPKSSQRPGQDDFAGLRDYQWQDSPQHIAWKSYASRDQLLVKQFHEAVAKTVWFDIESLSDNDVEVRLSQLCRMILDADKTQQNYGLRLGDIIILPNSGKQHRHNCLRALALFQLEDKIAEPTHD